MCSAVVDEVPGEEFVGPALPEGEEIRIDGAGAEGLIPAVLAGRQEHIGHPAVPPGQQGLDVGPLGEIGVHPDRS